MSVVCMGDLIARFQRQCAVGAQVAIVGPMLPVCPNLPVGPALFVDGGVRWRADLSPDSAHPALSVGDADSCGDLPLDIVLDRKKDCSDLEYALGVLQPLSLGGLMLLGFLGGRRDHEWINLAVVANFLSGQQQLCARFGDAVYVFAPGEYNLYHRGIFSLVHFDAADTSIRGQVDYPLVPAAHMRPRSGHGLSNEAHGEFVVASNAVTLCFLHRE